MLEYARWKYWLVAIVLLISALFALPSSAPGPAGSLPLTEDLLRHAPSGDLFGWTQNVGMGWDPAHLGRPEFLLLELFMRNSRQVLTRDVIFDRVWGYDFGPSSNSLEVYVGYLRRKTEANGEPRLIQTVRGVG